MGFLWLIFGVSLTVLVYSLVELNKTREVPFKWWQWLIIALWGGTIFITVATMFTMVGEEEAGAGLKFGIFLGLGLIITGVGIWRLMLSKKVKKSQAESVSA